MHRRIVLTPFNEQLLPLYAESIGFNSNQEPIHRPHGYPFYHWIQTVKGQGVITFDDQHITLEPNSGILLMPDVAHTYQASSHSWSTSYLTFGGPMVHTMLTSLHLDCSSYFKWEAETPFSRLVEQILSRRETNSDLFGLTISSDVYHFLLMLKKYGQLHKNTAISQNLEKLRPLLTWMDEHLDNPDIGLNQMSHVLAVSSRYLNALFRETFDMSPYTYFLHLRIRKAKGLLIDDTNVPVKQIATYVGFRDTSHFIATFRRIVGIPPERFRQLH